MISHKKAKPIFCNMQSRTTVIGFDQKNADKIFELFLRLHYKNELFGSGIGFGAMLQENSYKHKGHYRGLRVNPNKELFFIIISRLKNCQLGFFSLVLTDSLLLVSLNYIRNTPSPLFLIFKFPKTLVQTTK